ncbi:DHHA1 domain protein [Coriobacteriaceae bacterium BV3Ac1]|uniref:DHH family phosphoesterase n=1 Tax=Olegusella massiliensis TaxID=1776381 RepID=UPI0003ADB2C5|nr:bifunctional oligoribonuclease/PAP phosphatase NrnA [Olegusella massiliensis]ERL12656.1 DHHA1 domain protein [Coriobacteriaceae bacterium BV3Ac1]
MDISHSLEVSPQQTALFGRLTQLIEAAHEIVICAHTNPDGDALGSTLGLLKLLQWRWPSKQITGLLADPKPIPRIYEFLPGSKSLVCAADYHRTPDLFISVDLSVPSRMNDGEAVLKRSHHCAIIDHHPCSDPFAEVSLIRTDAAAAAVPILEYALYLGMPIDAEISLCLLCAIITDTGRFQYQNTNSEALAATALLVDAGASPSEVSLNVYQNFRLEFLHLKAAVMSRIVTFAHGRIAYSYATKADLERTGANLDEADGLVDVVRSVSGSEVALFLKEVPGGQVRGNLRSKTNLDISGVARSFGGGGHAAASGFSYDGDIDEVLSLALPRLRALFPDDVAFGGTTSFPRINIAGDGGALL